MAEHAFCHPELHSPYVVEHFLGAVGRVGWQLQSGPVHATTTCSLTTRPAHAAACRCLIISSIRAEAVNEFYGTNAPSSSDRTLPVLFFGDGSSRMTPSTIADQTPATTHGSRGGWISALGNKLRPHGSTRHKAGSTNPR